MRAEAHDRNTKLCYRTVNPFLLFPSCYRNSHVEGNLERATENRVKNLIVVCLHCIRISNSNKGQRRQFALIVVVMFRDITRIQNRTELATSFSGYALAVLQGETVKTVGIIAHK